MMNDINKNEWFYHAEGNANIILKNRQCDLVLRIRKSTSGMEIMSKKLASTHTIEEEINYFNMIVDPLFKNYRQYLVDSHVQIISKEFAEQVSQLVEGERPKHRKGKIVSLQEQSVLVMPFLGTFKCEERMEHVQCISVELKPKWGCLPFSEHIKSQHNVKRKVCRFCLHQVLKMKTKKVNEISQYCPLDLYGSCSCRVKHSVKSLFATPQNNLAITIDGQRVPIEEFERFFKGNNLLLCNSKEHLIDLLVDVLFHDSSSFVMQQPDRNRVCANSKFLQHDEDCKIMGSGGILNVLRKLQSLDDFDIECIGELIRSKKVDIQKNEISNYNSNVWKNFIENTLNKSPNKGVITSIDDIKTKICEYLVSNTIKDCTIIITLCNPSKDLSIEGDGIQSFQSFLGLINYQMKLVDFDPRLVENIPYYNELDHDIVSTYLAETARSICCP